jgi:SAM-dependent methyltransferase
MRTSKALPNFAERDDDTKNVPMDVPIVPPEYIRRYLERQLAARRARPESLRIIDVGCGRGDTVAWLCTQGWDAYGVDVSADYVGRGRAYLARTGSDPERLQLLDRSFVYPFDDNSFDLVLSDQVIEHIDDLGSFVSEVARISASGASGLHIYPAKWHPVETHLRIPCAHWLRKGPLRRAAIAAALRAGLAAPYFPEHSVQDRAEIYNRFSEDETFYRSLRSTVSVFRDYGLECDEIRASRDKIGFHLPRAPKAALPLLGWLYRHVSSVVLHTYKP